MLSWDNAESGDYLHYEDYDGARDCWNYIFIMLGPINIAATMSHDTSRVALLLELSGGGPRVVWNGLDDTDGWHHGRDCPYRDKS